MAEDHKTMPEHEWQASHNLLKAEIARLKKHNGALAFSNKKMLEGKNRKIVELRSEVESLKRENAELKKHGGILYADIELGQQVDDLTNKLKIARYALSLLNEYKIAQEALEKINGSD